MHGSAHGAQKLMSEILERSVERTAWKCSGEETSTTFVVAIVKLDVGGEEGVSVKIELVLYKPCLGQMR